MIMRELHEELKKIRHLEVSEYDEALPSITLKLKHAISPAGVRFAATKHGFHLTRAADQLAPIAAEHAGKIGVFLDHPAGTSVAQQTFNFKITGEKIQSPALRTKLIAFFKALNATIS